MVAMMRPKRYQYFRDTFTTFSPSNLYIYFFAHAAIQVDKLLEVVVGGTNMCPTATSSVPEDPFVQPPVVAPSHDAGLGRDAMATVMAQLEALKLANAEQQAKLRAYELDKAEHKTEVKKLREKVTVTTLIPVTYGEIVWAHLVRRAFPVPPPFSLVHHPTTWAR